MDRLLATRKHRLHLLNLGVAPRRLSVLDAWLFAAPYGTVAAISFSLGIVICAVMVGFSDILMPWYTMGAALVAAIVIGFVGTAGVTLLGARSIRENPE